MRTVLFTFLLGFVLNGAFAQQGKEQSCYEAYKKEFDERGAYNVEDGKYTGVIIAIVTSSGTDCLYGKVQVEGGHVTAMWLMFEDNSYEYLDRKYKTGNGRARIVNGITEPLVSTDNETFYVVFIDKIKPKKKQYKKVQGPGSNF